MDNLESLGAYFEAGQSPVGKTFTYTKPNHGLSELYRVTEWDPVRGEMRVHDLRLDKEELLRISERQTDSRLVA